jgi:hypothetical protein
MLLMSFIQLMMTTDNAEASGSGSNQPIKRITRDRNGCLVCRTRRVKCDLGESNPIRSAHSQVDHLAQGVQIMAHK